MQAIIKNLEQAHRKPALPPVQSGDTVRVYQRITEGGKSRVQMFEGVVIRTRRPNELMADVTVRRLSSGIGVEKTFLLHSPNVVKLEIVRRARVRRNYLTYLRDRRGKSARLQELAFDRAAVNVAASAPKAEAPADEIATQPAVARNDGDGVSDDAPVNADETPVSADEPVVEAEVSEGDVPIEKLEKAENRAAASEDVAADPDAQDDEAAMSEVEVEQGLNRAEPKQ